MNKQTNNVRTHVRIHGQHEYIGSVDLDVSPSVVMAALMLLTEHNDE